MVCLLPARKPKIAFIQKDAYEKISVHYLAGACRAYGIDCQVFIYDLEEDFWSSLISYEPAYVAYSLFIGEEKWAFACLKRVKEILPKTKTLVGGPFTLIFPKIYWQQEVDFVFRGEGEKTLPDFIRRVEAGEHLGDVDGIQFIGDDGTEYLNNSILLADIRCLPAPDRDVYYKYESLKNDPRKIFIASRGCPYRCTYCYNAELAEFYDTRFWRQREVDDVLNEIKYVRDAYGLKWVHFQDGTFNADKSWLFSFLKQYSAAGLPPFMCNARVENINEDIIRLLKDAGCNRITFGVQSGNPRIRKDVAGRIMSNEQIIEATRLCKKHGIRFCIDVIFGWPSETLEEALDTIRLCRQIKAESYSSNVLVFYPGLRITNYAFKEGYIANIPTLEEIYELNLNRSLLLNKNKKLLVNLDKLFFYFIKYPYLEFFLLKLLYVPPNRIFLLMKNVHHLLRNFKYEQRQSKFLITLNYIKVCWNSDKDQRRAYKL